LPHALPVLLQRINLILYVAQEKNIQYVLDWYEGQLSHSSFRGFPIYLSRILSIVAQNAVKFTPENGEIHVWMNEKCLDDSTSLLEFRCKDNGIGMSQDLTKVPIPFSLSN